MSPITTISTTVRYHRASGSVRLVVLRLGMRLGSVLWPGATVRRAADLFCTPLPSSRRRALASPAGGAVEGRLLVEGLEIRTYTWGDPRTQPYVLFSHGWSSHGTRFLPWVQHLAERGFAAVAFDQPAHGRSQGQRTTLPAFARTLAHVGAHFGPAAALIGHSLGGAAATVALASGLAAERTVLLAPAADPVDATMRFGRLVGLPARLCRSMVAAFEDAVGITFDELQAHHQARLVARPALIVHDLADPEVPWAEGERYARYWHGARLLNTEGLGHNRIVDDPGVISAVCRFLRGDSVGERVVSTPALPYGLA